MATVQVAKIPGIEKLSSGDQKGLVQAAQWIGVDPGWLAAIFKFEGNFNPAQKNLAGSGAVGLIQFMPSTAKRLGTTTEALAKMSFQQQLEYVKKYFSAARGKIKSLEDTYLIVFYPAAVGKPLDYVIGTKDDPATGKVYEQNRGFDKAGKGYITKNDVTSTIRNVFATAKGQTIAVNLGITLGTMVVAGVIGYVGYRKFLAPKANA